MNSPANTSSLNMAKHASDTETCQRVISDNQLSDSSARIGGPSDQKLKLLSTCPTTHKDIDMCVCAENLPLMKVQ